jgi:hypothetical protein
MLATLLNEQYTTTGVASSVSLVQVSAVTESTTTIGEWAAIMISVLSILDTYLALTCCRISVHLEPIDYPGVAAPTYASLNFNKDEAEQAQDTGDVGGDGDGGNAGMIAGAVIGGVACVGLIVAAVVLAQKKRSGVASEERSKSAADVNDQSNVGVANPMKEGSPSGVL